MIIKRALISGVAAAAIALSPSAAFAQTADPPPPAASAPSPAPPDATNPAGAPSAQPASSPDAAQSSSSSSENPASAEGASPDSSEGHFVGRFVRDVGGDYVHFFSWDTALWLGIGGGAALAVHPADETLHEQAENGDWPHLTGGAEWGSQYVQIPLAVGWWITGAVAGSPKTAAVGRDMLRAQISAASWAYAIKYATDRTRPNGDPRSFPSGHATTAFATATVLATHYGWKVGVPLYAMATYTAMSRVAANQHWLSDVVFGSFVGIAAGRTVTVRLRQTPFKVQPVATHGGAAVLFTTTRSPS